MKYLKLALAIGIPVALAIGGYLLLRTPRAKAPLAPVASRGKRGTSTSSLSSRAVVPRSRWKKVPPPAYTVTPVPRPRPIPDVDDAKVLSLELLKSLIADNSAAAWNRIRELLRTGRLEDPSGIEALLVKTLGRGGNYSAHVMALLPMLKDQDLRRKTAEDLMRLAATTRDSQTLRALFQVVGEMGDGTMVAQLGELADSLTDHAAVTQAILAIGRIGTPESAAELVRLLKESPDASRLLVIQNAIANVRTADMVADLTPLLLDDQPDNLRVAAATALGRTGLARAVDPLKALLEGSSDRAVKEASLGGLGHIMTKDAVEELLKIRKSNGALWYEAGLAIGNGHADKQAAEVLLKELDDETDPRIRVSMISALSGSNAPGVEDKLVSYVKEGEQPASVRAYAARALGHSDSTAVVAPLAESLKSSGPGDGELRRSILNSFAKLAHTRSMSEELKKKALPAVEEMAKQSHDPRDQFWLQRTLRILKGL